MHKRRTGLLLVLILFGSPASGEDGCKYDTQCKGDRVCEEGTCISPPKLFLFPQSSSPMKGRLIKTTRKDCQSRRGNIEALHNSQGDDAAGNRPEAGDLVRCVLPPGQ